MARRVRVNKSLIKQRYHVAKVAFPDDADLARSLGVHRSAVVRWKRGEAPAAKNWEQLVGLDTVVYLAETAVHAVAEKLQRFRGQKIDRQDLIESGKTLALVEGQLRNIKLADLCDPHTLVKYDIRPDVLASRDIAKTHAVAAALHKEGFAGLRWWSALAGDWHTIVVFEGAIEYGTPEPLTIAHPAVQDASVALGIQYSVLTRQRWPPAARPIRRPADALPG